MGRGWSSFGFILSRAKAQRQGSAVLGSPQVERLPRKGEISLNIMVNFNTPIYPSEILADELEEIGLRCYHLAQKIGISEDKLN